MLAFSGAWYNGSYTIAAKPIKSLELHYTTIQFLIMIRGSPLFKALWFLMDFLATFIIFIIITLVISFIVAK